MRHRTPTERSDRFDTVESPTLYLIEAPGRHILGKHPETDRPRKHVAAQLGNRRAEQRASMAGAPGVGP